jgi:hypothetical protein
MDARRLSARKAQIIPVLLLIAPRRRASIPGLSAAEKNLS